MSAFIARVFLTLGVLAVAAGTALAVQTRTFEGRVTDVQRDHLTLEVAGEKVTLAGDERLFGQVKEGQTVSVQAQPDLEAAKVALIEGSFAGDQLVGTVAQIGKDSVKVKTLDNREETIRVKSELANKLAVGKQVVIGLKEDPSRAKNWRATRVQPVQRQPAPGGTM